jgi:2-phosphosulfolactate phosphatase
MTRHLARWELDGVAGAVVVVDVIRAFTTAAYAFGSGAAEIYLVATVDEALEFKAANPGSLAMGEERGLRPDGFDFPNSPAMVREADLDGRTLVQRTSAGTQGVVRAVDATRLWAASLAVASATARAVEGAGLGGPAYVITGRFEDRPDGGVDDVLAAELIERARTHRPLESPATAAALLTTEEAARTLALGAEHTDPRDIELAAVVDAFDFAMEVERTDRGLRLVTSRSGRTSPTVPR